MNTLAILSLTAVAVLATACGQTTEPGAGTEVVTAEVIYRTAQCSGGIREPAMTWIEDATALTQLLARLDPPFPGSSAPSIPVVDFAHERVLLIDMGEHPTAGYGLALGAPAPTREDGRLTITVQWTEPPPGAITAQVLTHPCLLLKFPRLNTTTVRVVDQHGQTRIQTHTSGE